MNDFNILTRLQEDLRARLLTALPSGVSVLLQREGALETGIAEALGTLNTRNGQLGAAAVVRMPRLELAQSCAASGVLGQFAGDSWEDRPGPQLLAHLEVEVWENRLLNQPAAESETEPLPTAEALALRALTALHRYRPGSSAGGSWLASRKAIEPLPAKRPGLAGYLVRLETQFGLEPPESVERPDGAADGNPGGPWTLNLICATPAAAIYHTRDGSFPHPENPTATLYTEPTDLFLEVGETTLTLRAAAYLSSLQPSDVLELIV